MSRPNSSAAVCSRAHVRRNFPFLTSFIIMLPFWLYQFLGHVEQHFIDQCANQLLAQNAHRAEMCWICFCFCLCCDRARACVCAYYYFFLPLDSLNRTRWMHSCLLVYKSVYKFSLQAFALFSAARSHYIRNAIVFACTWDQMNPCIQRCTHAECSFSMQISHNHVQLPL